MTADEFQEPVDCCKWRRLQRADGDWYNCKIEDCRNWHCKYSTTAYVPSGPDDAESGGGGGTQSTTTRPATTTTPSRRKLSTTPRSSLSDAQRNTSAAEASASSRTSYGADEDLDPVVAAATAELDAMIANGTIPRTPPGFPYPYRRPSRAQSAKKEIKKEEKN